MDSQKSDVGGKSPPTRVLATIQTMVGVGVQRAIAEVLLRHAGVDLIGMAPESEVPDVAEVLQDA